MSVYDKLKEIFDAKQAGKTDRAIPGERNCRVGQYGNGYAVRLHGNIIIIAYPENMLISNAGWATPVTHARLWSIAKVRVYNDSRLQVENTYRVMDRVRGHSLPMGRDIRMDYNGRVLDADVKSDFKKRVDMKVKAKYDKLCREVWKKIAARAEVGEFHVEVRAGVLFFDRLNALERMVETDFPTHEDVLGFMVSAPVSTEGWKAVTAALRESYYQRNNGYWMEEFPHK